MTASPFPPQAARPGAPLQVVITIIGSSSIIIITTVCTTYVCIYVCMYIYDVIYV